MRYFFSLQRKKTAKPDSEVSSDEDEPDGEPTDRRKERSAERRKDRSVSEGSEAESEV